MNENERYIKAARRVTDVGTAADLLRASGLEALAEAAEAALPVLRDQRRAAEAAWRKADYEASQAGGDWVLTIDDPDEARGAVI
jgi:hypothetical protein